MNLTFSLFKDTMQNSHKQHIQI